MTWGITLFLGNDMGNNSVPGGMAWGITLFLIPTEESNKGSHTA